VFITFSFLYTGTNGGDFEQVNRTGELIFGFHKEGETLDELSD
jgi:hypothetical protein